MPALLKRFGPITLVAVGLILALALGLPRYLSFEALAERRLALEALVAAKPLIVMGGFVAIYVFATAVALPGAIWITIAGGFLFGPWLGAGLSAASATTGAFALFMATRSALGEGLRAKAGGFAAKVEKGFRENAFSYLLTLRLLPVAPFFGVNLAAAVLGVPARTFLVATAIGILPAGFVYASLGAGLGHAFAQGRAPNLSLLAQPEIFLPLVALACLALVPVVVKLARRKPVLAEPEA